MRKLSARNAFFMAPQLRRHLISAYQGGDCQFPENRKKLIPSELLGINEVYSSGDSANRLLNLNDHLLTAVDSFDALGSLEPIDRNQAI